MKVESVSVDEISPDPANARMHDRRNLDAIAGSLRKWGQQKPIVISEAGVIVAGNGTWEAAKQIGWKRINAVRTKLEGSEAVAYGIADNRTAELAVWDDAVLARHLEAKSR
jgi:ParB-like chromosome segregation protein Spo0J